MLKKKIILISTIVVILATAAVAYAVTSFAPKTPSDYKLGIKYSQAVESDKPMLALFYVDWCGYCMRFMPKYKVISNIYKDKYNIVMLNAENPENKTLAEDVSLSGFPTLYIMDPKYDNRILLNNAIYQDMTKLKVELDRYLRIRALLDKASK